MGLLTGFGELFLPRRCAGCGREDVSLCTACLHLLGGIPRAMEPRYGQIPVVGVSEYSTQISHMVVNFKDNGRRDILDPLALALARSITAALELAHHSGGRVRLFPAPSSPQALRRRGRSHTAALARRAAQLVPELSLEVIDVLLTRHHHDQVGLGAHAREANVARSQYLNPTILDSAIGRPGGETESESGVDLLIDDFSTTGATLAESARVLASVQIRPAAGAVLGLGRGGTRFVSPFTV
ncbi:MAG: ComF family protein [Brevibacterium aurantiacum]|uniref:Amidophosphoribosyltransferase n=1 Tax=Brevibacterium aurantiacum TaxID=273384 RepID=A0A1D7W2G8_BREAU|nr:MULTISPECIES: ComF family protein [Brevibacterium]MDN5550039.1 ComF family protein [Brevibacterium sp.]AOP53227.1 Competence F-like protein, phosphoribosyltransferase domain [Brevibacterium aurantiacum]AZL09045.1 ComF family protein [Brevibacterium aurantiacum]AZT93132.1 ComF family protein [Brevibacterium aurantiacum]AZT96915.1 ComF family protein [Brevibacterium aurantiacum]